MAALVFMGVIISGAVFSVWVSAQLNGSKAGEMLLAGYMSMTFTLGFLQAIRRMRKREN